MCKRALCLGMIFVSLLWGVGVAQQPELSALSIGERDRWQTDVISLLRDNWYFRVTVGALANVHPGPFQASGFTHFRLGLVWSPEWSLSPRLHLTRATHEISIGLEGLGTTPQWVLEITPFIFEFDLTPRPAPARSTATPEQPVMQPDQNELLKGLQEAHLRTGLHRLVSAFVLFREQVQRQTTKVCTGLYVSEDQKTEEVLSPLMTEVLKKITFTNKQTGTKETFTLKESKCF